MKYLHWREHQTSTQGFPRVLITWWGGGFQEKGKYIANICTNICIVASKLKNVIFLLNKTLSNKIKVTAFFPLLITNYCALQQIYTAGIKYLIFRGLQTLSPLIS